MSRLLLSGITTVLLAACALGCGRDDGDLSLSLSVPFLAAQGASCNDSYFGGTSTLSAVLLFSGNIPACTGLTVDTTSFTVSGSCPAITTGSVRFVSLEYTLTSSLSVAAQLLAIVTYLDLRPDTLHGTGDVTLDLSSPAPPQAIILSSPTEVAALPTDDSVCNALDDNTPDRFLCQAERWWLWYHLALPPDYDRNKNGQSNVQEACAGTLF